MKRPTALGAYIFAGGFTVGVKKHFDVLAHFEGNDYGVSTAKLNWPDLPIFYPKPKWPVADYAGKVDFLYCNPPCAIFSTMGISTTRGKGAWKDDPRLGCWLDCFELVEELQPSVWAIESVTQAYGTGRPLIDELTWRGRSLGYSVTHLFVNAKWHGVPQERKRFFLVGHRTANLIRFPLNWAPPTTVGEALREAASPGAVRSSIREERWIVDAKPGEKLSNVYNRLIPENERVIKENGHVIGRPSYRYHRLDSNRTMPVYTSDAFVHPTEDRWIGENEAKALCGYPQEFQLDGPVAARGSLLARAVMPPVGEWIARSALATLEHLEAHGPSDITYATRVDLREPDLDVLDLTTQYVTPRPMKGERTMTVPKLLFTEIVKEVERDNRLDDEYGPKKRAPAVADGLDEFGPDLTQSRDPLAEYGPARADLIPGDWFIKLPVIDEAAPIPKKTWRRLAPTGDVIAPSNDPPAAGEPSGRYIKRLLLAGQNSPEEIVVLVHKHYATSKASVADVRYHHYHLGKDGRYPNLKPWPGKAKRVAAAPPVKLSSEPRAATPTNRTIGAGTILLTGCTPIQVGSPHTHLKILTAATGWKIALEKMGYSVDWRPVTPGEDVSAYHRCFVILSKPNAIASRHFYGALWVLINRPDAIIGFDDWQTYDVVKGLKTCANSRERAFRLVGWRSSDNAQTIAKYEDRLFDAVKSMALTIWSWPAIVPVFRGGDLKSLGIPTLIFAADPTILTPRYDVPTDVVKNRRWVQASLLLKPPPVGLTWPVQFFGNAGRGRGGVGKSDERAAETRLTEPELMNEYARSWGILSPAHTHPGSGWWRVRYLMSADAGCVLSAHPDEARVLGDPYAAAADPRKIEKMSDSELECLAQAQAQCLERIAMSEDELCHVLRTVMER